jgi:hypothetical protein
LQQTDINRFLSWEIIIIPEKMTKINVISLRRQKWSRDLFVVIYIKKYKNSSNSVWSTCQVPSKNRKEVVSIGPCSFPLFYSLHPLRANDSPPNSRESSNSSGEECLHHWLLPNNVISNKSSPPVFWEQEYQLFQNYFKDLLIQYKWALRNQNQN